MRAIRFHEFGGIEKLKLEKIPDLQPGEGEVLLRTLACSLNHVDIDIRKGTSRLPVSLPHTPGIEMVGRIEAIGAGVDGNWRRGDRVLPYLIVSCGSCSFCRTSREPLCPEAGSLGFVTDGGYAEALRCPASQLLPAPECLSDEEAAAFPIAFGTAWHMLFTIGKLRAGETVLINSIGSGIGSAALQLCKLAGAFVIGTTSSDAKLQRAAAYGLDVGINYIKEDVAAEVMKVTGTRGADVVFEHVGGPLFQAGLDALAKDGRMVLAGGHAGEIVPFDIIPFFRDQKSIFGSTAFSRADLQTVLDILDRGWIKPVVHGTFPLEQVRDATALLERREHFGKIVLTI